jgi:hypothetical protein
MKKCMITIILLLVIGSVICVEPESMRSVATGGIFSGTWDNLFDTIKLGKTDSLYIFTNLSDFNVENQSNYNSIYENSETRFFEELPLGIAFTNPFIKEMKHALFIRFRNTLTPEYPYGETEIYTTEYVDMTGDDIYDNKIITYNKESSYAEDDNVFDFIWNNSYQAGNIDFGLKFSSFCSQEEIDNCKTNMGIYDFDPYGYINGADSGDQETDSYIELYDLEDENWNYRITEKGDYLTESENDHKQFLLSLEMDNDFLASDSRLRFNLGMDMDQNLSQKTSDKYTASYTQIVIVDTLVNRGSITDTYNNEYCINENNIYLSSVLKKELDSYFESEPGFWEFGLLGCYITGDKESSHQSHLVSERYDDALMPDDSEINTSDEYFNTMDKGDYNGFNLAAQVKFNLPLNEYAAFGIGGYYDYSLTNLTSDYESEILKINTYQYGLAMDNINDLFITETEFLSADKESITKETSLRIPVALEFKFPDYDITDHDGFGLRNFVFRLGSTFILNGKNTENNYNVIESLPNFIITEYGDGTITEQHDGENTLSSQKTINKYLESRKRFSAGIGYKHSRNVSIDLGGYYDFNDEIEYSYIGLAFTIKM